MSDSGLVTDGDSEVSDTDKASIRAIVEGIQRSSAKRRRSARRGWAFLGAAGLYIPTVSASVGGSISLSGALVRLALALAIAILAANVAGTMIEAYQRDAATATVERALTKSRAEALGHRSSTQKLRTN